MALSQIKPHQIKGFAFGLLVVLAIFAVESKSAIAAYQSQEDHLSGLQAALISVVFALLATFAFSRAGALKEDYRPQVHSRAFVTRIVALIFCLAPIGFLGSALKANNVEERWQAYTTAAPGQLSAYQIDQTTASDMMADTFERREARSRITRPTSDLSLADGEWWIAAFFVLSLLFAADVLRVPAPMSEAEFQHLKRSLAAKKGAAKRKEAARKRAETKRRAERKPLFGLIQGGRK